MVFYVHLSDTTCWDATTAGLFAFKLWPSGDSLLHLDTVNPGMPIAAEVSTVHGITDKIAAGSPPFAADRTGVSEGVR